MLPGSGRVFEVARRVAGNSFEPLRGEQTLTGIGQLSEGSKAGRGNAFRTAPTNTLRGAGECLIGRKAGRWRSFEPVQGKQNADGYRAIVRREQSGPRVKISRGYGSGWRTPQGRILPAQNPNLADCRPISGQKFAGTEKSGYLWPPEPRFPRPERSGIGRRNVPTGEFSQSQVSGPGRRGVAQSG